MLTTSVTRDDVAVDTEAVRPGASGRGGRRSAWHRTGRATAETDHADRDVRVGVVGQDHVVVQLAVGVGDTRQSTAGCAGPEIGSGRLQAGTPGTGLPKASVTVAVKTATSPAFAYSGAVERHVASRRDDGRGDRRRLDRQLDGLGDASAGDGHRDHAELGADDLERAGASPSRVIVFDAAPLSRVVSAPVRISAPLSTVTVAGAFAVPPAMVIGRASRSRRQRDRRRAAMILVAAGSAVAPATAKSAPVTGRRCS